MQKGSTASVMIGFESTYGTVATDGFVLPVNYGEGVVGSQAVNRANTIRGNRNPNQPFRGNRDVAGPVPIPIDSVCLPYWLTAMLGDPTSAGTDPYTHEWKIANTQPSFSLEKAFTDLDTDRYARFLGCKIGGFSITIGGDGELMMTLNVVGASDSFETSAFDATPTSPSLSRINNFHGAVEEGGASSSIITQCSLNVDFGLDTRPDIIPVGNSGVRAELPEGSVGVSGSVRALFTDAGYTLLAKGIAGTESSLKLTFTAAANSIFEIELQELEYARTGVPLEGPQGLLLDMPFEAFYENGSEASALVLRVTNATASYDLIS